MTPRSRCTSVNSLGFHCGHYALEGIDKCQFHATRFERRLADEHKDARWRGNPDGKTREELRAEELPFDSENIKTASGFAQAVLGSLEFQEYIMQGIRKRDIAPSILLRLMDYAEGWGKPTDKVEHVGEPITEIRRVVVTPRDEKPPVQEPVEEQRSDVPTIPVPSQRMH